MQPDATPLKLSIDIKAQTLVREELSNAVREFNAKGAIGVLQHVNSGEIIAMVSLPDFDPHKPGQANPDALFNRATLGNYEIGSVFKAFTVAMALDSSTVNLNNVYDVSTPILISGAKIQDYQAKGGWMSVPQILMNSSNIGVSQMVMEMGKKAQFKYLKSFGLTSQLEIELNEKAAPYFRSEGKWSDLDSAIASYGYGIAASPLHLVKAMSAVVNGGKLYPPTLLAEQNHSPQQILKPSTSYNMNRLLRMVVRFGSGRKADVDGLFVAGKTGTANKLRNGKYDENLRISSFLSTFPAHKPEYVLLVTLDEPQPNKNTYGFATGGWVAAPATAKIIEKLSLALKIFPEYENKEAKERALFVEYNPKASASA
jgi:cell division protein FtsI (penicillin-binding protein 3)